MRIAKTLIISLILLAISLALVVTALFSGCQRKASLKPSATTGAHADGVDKGDGSSADSSAVGAGQDVTPEPATFPQPPGWSFVEIKPGSFTMGSAVGEIGRLDNELQHKVTLTHGFWMGKYEVTQQQYEELMGTNPSKFPGPKRPVEGVSWSDAQEFIKKLNTRERAAGRIPVGWAYRLPTEAEWEYAARAGTTTAYSFGDGAGVLGEYAWYIDNSARQSHEVGLKDPNPWGLYDMYGNVWELCADWYDAYPTGDVTDPTGPATGECRVLRGAGWYGGPARTCRSAHRCLMTPDGRSNDIGIRILAAQASSQ